MSGKANLFRTLRCVAMPLTETFASPERCHASRRMHMDREHVKGAADKAKGAIKDTAGKLTGDKELQSEGKLDKAKGAAHDAAGNVKDAVRDLTK
jgi:uncharacterized protein YjbJ (UPF0337 family)